MCILPLRNSLRGITVRTCKVCGVEKNRTEFYKHGPGQVYLMRDCKECHNEKYGRGEFKKKRRARQLYGISLDDYDRMVESHGGVCALCKKQKPLHIDHCHITGKVRGLLCFNCNAGLGNLGDDPDMLRRGIEYLQAGVV